MVAAARINKIQVPVYADVPWRYPDVPDEQVMVLHTLVVDPGTAGHLPDARPLASSAMREAGLDELYNSRKAAQQLEAALCPPVGDGSLLQPELFHMELQGALTALRDSDKPAVRAFVRDELAPLLENTELLRAYTGLMVGG